MQDDENVSDDFLRSKAYEEFELEELDRQNIDETKKTLDKGQITSSNKEMYIDTLLKLHKKLREIKKAEYDYEGEENRNINEYISEIEDMIKKINNIL